MLKLTAYLLTACVFLWNQSYARIFTDAVWIQTYYDGTSLKTTEPSQFCSLMTPGTFIGSVGKQLKNGSVTNTGIELSHFTFSQKNTSKGIIIVGTVVEKKHLYDKAMITDLIHYNLKKITEYSVTTGVWYNSKCKGKYIGKLVGSVASSQ
jgi:hypothetical protein